MTEATWVWFVFGLVTGVCVVLGVELGVVILIAIWGFRRERRSRADAANALRMRQAAERATAPPQ